MRILGIVHEHNATVCLLENGKIIFCQSEERLNRIKNSSGFPVQTLEHVYNHLAPPETINLAVIYEKTITGYLHTKARAFQPTQGGQYLDPKYLHPSAKRRVLRTDLGWKLREMKWARIERNASLRHEAELYFSRMLKLDNTSIKYLDHHLSHAYSVVPNISEWGEALILTLDGYGDGLCATVSFFDHGKLRRLSACNDRHSLGNYYCDTAWILGMKSLEDEYKIMGLAAYAKPKHYQSLLECLRRLLTIDEKGEWKSRPNPEKRFAELERIYRFQRFDNVAGAIQNLTEELITKWASYWISKTGCRNVAVSGGVFMNVKATQRLAELREIDRLFVMPSAGDESCAIGCVSWASLAYDRSMPLQPLTDLCLGVEFSNAEIEKALSEAGAESRFLITRPANISQQAAKLLAQNEIVARFSGRMEFGARALGNRSILANPCDPRNVLRINGAIKGRDFWMPFAPSILEEDVPRYVCNHERIFAPYMCIAFCSTTAAQRDIPAAIHPKDHTLRPQAVRRDWNRAYYDVLYSFKELTGIGAVLNTSFNLHGEPIVCSPLDAICTVDRSGLDYLILGEYLLSKRSPANSDR